MSQSGFVLRHLVSITAFARLPARDRMNSHAPLSRHSKLLQEILVCIANSSDSSRANVSQDCISAFNDLKLAKKYKYIIFKLSDDNREIVIEEASGDKDWENFREKLIKATSKTKSGAVCKGPRYAVYDFEYSLASGEGSRLVTQFHIQSSPH
ncbi:hypothetical protein F4679DRAFT_6174 [Xylaria curta]|nr:hypothetical protein F4679DRAFT_6174 [Xylaria curta]